MRRIFESPSSFFKCFFSVFFPDLLVKFVVSSLLDKLVRPFGSHFKMVELVSSVTVLLTPSISFIMSVKWTLSLYV